MDTSTLRFYPGSNLLVPSPLARYLPPLAHGIVSGWLSDNGRKKGWLLDPLGASPALALEAARAGYRVLVASNNPILSFILETLAAAPKSADFQSALAELAVSKRGDERLEKHIQSLYQTECDTCGLSIPALAFLWRKDETQPYARIYRCPKCGESGERPVTPADLERLAGMGGDRMQRARALQRVLMDDADHRADVETALDNYPSRPLYVLFTLLNKIEGLGLPPNRLRLLQALLLSAFDAGSTLWPHSSGRSRPRQLTIPPQFRENNLWIAMEEAVGDWAQTQAAVPVTQWPDQPPEEGGICIYRGRVKALVPLPDEIGPQAVLTAFPRPNQAFWTLSVLWAGWLWGSEATLPIRNVLDRRRYDWHWHTSAVHNALSSLGWSLPQDTPFFGLVPELAPGFLSAMVVAGEAGGFRLDGLSLREDQELAQILWHPVHSKDSRAGSEEETSRPFTGEMLERAAREAMQADLLARGEPATYIDEYAAGLWALARSGLIPHRLNSIPGDLLTRVQAGLARTFANRSFLKFYSIRPDGDRASLLHPPTNTRTPAGAGEASVTTGEVRGWWWLAGQAGELAPPRSSAGAGGIAPSRAEANPSPLTDRIEIEVVRFMQKNAVFTFSQMEESLCTQFTGLMTPSRELLHAILESYGETIPSQPGGWRMRTGENAAARRTDLEEVRAALEAIGRQLNYRVAEEKNALVWLDENGEGGWWFYRMASSIISRFVLTGAPGPRNRCFLVIPGSRVRLLRLKLRRDPRLAEAVQGWRFLKFRHLREIAQQETLTRAGWQVLVDDDPLMDEPMQMALFST